ncbi:MAG: alpha/beta hydrolase [Burkholderiaceae bacterium]|jgi:dienelactone hydrolase
MRERALQAGPDLNLFGILTEPAHALARADDPLVLILNAGLLHHVGPHRMSVELARGLAAHGLASFRLDIGGRGESETASESRSDEERVLEDIKQVMDYLEHKLRRSRFVLFGLCAGADNAHAVAVRDPRVVGAILLDGYGYRTLSSYLWHYLPRIWRVSPWMRYARRKLGPPPAVLVDFGIHGERRPFAPRMEVEGEIQKLVDRGAELLYVYTGGVEYYYNYANQFRDMFKGLNGRGRIAVEHYPAADHTYTFSEDRERLLSRVVEWCSSRSWHAG